MQAYPGLTPEAIRRMTPYVQEKLLNPPGSDTITFPDEESYQRWRASNWTTQR